MPPIAAEAPKATCARAQELLVLEDLAAQDRLLVGADPELGDVGALGARRAQQLHQPLSPLAAGGPQVPALDHQLGGLVAQPDGGDRAVDDQAPLAWSPPPAR